MRRNGSSPLLGFVFAAVIQLAVATFGEAQEVSLTTEMISMPTYTMGPDEKQPIFRGFTVPGMNVFRAARTTYPYPRADNFVHEREMKEYEAITLENEFIKAVVIPDLRGRLQGAYDKRNGWDFIYYNHVIKPGDIGNRAGWLSGGLEWNHPGGHGYTQFERISTKIIEHADGARTVLVAEIEPVRMMKWETAITLRPGSLAVETEGRFYSIAPYPVPFASSLNGAMHATEEMEAIYPEGTYITGHGKHYVKPFPFYDGVDHSWYRNLKNGYSVFSEGCIEDFYGCYSHDMNGGTVIVADHRTAPGKKYFSWGSHPAGRRWDQLLSDEDGGYIELQTGAFWDNLGYGNAWLDPLEVKKYTVFWYPVKDIGGFVKASEQVVMNLKKEDTGKVSFGVQAVHLLEGTSITITGSGKTLFEEKLDMDPAEPYMVTFRLPEGVKYGDLLVTIVNEKGREIMTYEPLAEHPPAPELPKRRVSPEEAETIDDLYMWGKGFYQDPFGLEPESYFREILKRDTEDARGNLEMGLMALHRGQYELAIEYLEKSFRSDPLNHGFNSQYYIGLAALGLDDLQTARESFVVASRVKSLKVPAVYQMAVIAMREGDTKTAVSLLKEAITDGGIHPQLQSTLAVAYRMLGDDEGSAAAVNRALAEDPLEFAALLEQWKTGSLSTQEIHKTFDRRAPFLDGPAPFFIGSHLYVEGAIFYERIGSLDDAISILEEGVLHLSTQGELYPMMEYYLGYIYEKQGREQKAFEAFANAGKRSSDYVFPCCPMDIAALSAAVKHNPSDARAWAYMGNALFYLRRYEEAEIAWLNSTKSDPAEASVLRSLAHVDWGLRKDLTRVVGNMEKASAADPSDARILMELDYFLAAAGDTERRMELFSEREATVRARDELVLAYSRLLLRTGDFVKAVDLMDNRQFFARESRAMAHAVYAEAHYGLGEEWLGKGEYAKAIEEFNKGMQYPENLGEGALAGEVFSRAKYLTGLASREMGMKSEAKTIFKAVSEEPVRADTESMIYRAMALRELGKDAEATSLLRDTESLCREELSEDPNRAALVRFLLSRALEELGKEDEARDYLRKALEEDPDVILHARMEASIKPSSSNLQE